VCDSEGSSASVSQTGDARPCPGYLNAADAASLPAVVRARAVRALGWLLLRRDRFGRLAEYLETALEAQGRRLLVVDQPGADDDLVPYVTEILTSLCARLYGRRAAAGRAGRAVGAVTGDAP
jgi:predicted site-specific integrase-resolvase